MRYRYDLGLRFEGPERLCSWCAELATDCSCTKKLTNQYVAAQCGSLLSSSRMPDAPRAVRADAILAAVLPRAEPHYGPFLTHAQRILRRRFWCPHCKRERLIHGCNPSKPT